MVIDLSEEEINCLVRIINSYVFREPNSTLVSPLRSVLKKLELKGDPFIIKTEPLDVIVRVTDVAIRFSGYDAGLTISPRDTEVAKALLKTALDELS